MSDTNVGLQTIKANESSFLLTISIIIIIIILEIKMLLKEWEVLNNITKCHTEEGGSKLNQKTCNVLFNDPLRGNYHCNLLQPIESPFDKIRHNFL